MDTQRQFESTNEAIFVLSSSYSLPHSLSFRPSKTNTEIFTVAHIKLSINDLHILPAVLQAAGRIANTLTNNRLPSTRKYLNTYFPRRYVCPLIKYNHTTTAHQPPQQATQLSPRSAPPAKCQVRRVRIKQEWG